jgi:hypothetical protein
MCVKPDDKLLELGARLRCERCRERGLVLYQSVGRSNWTKFRAK